MLYSMLLLLRTQKQKAADICMLYSLKQGKESTETSAPHLFVISTCEVEILWNLL